MGMFTGMLMRGQPLTTKLAKWATYGVFPAAMAAAVIYSPPGYTYSKDSPKSTK